MPTPNSLTICPVCSVKLIDNSTVLWSTGSNGTKADLKGRVCQYAKQSGCINDYSGEGIGYPAMENIDTLGNEQYKQFFKSGEVS